MSHVHGRWSHTPACSREQRGRGAVELKTSHGVRMAEHVLRMGLEVSMHDDADCDSDEACCGSDGTDAECDACGV